MYDVFRVTKVHPAGGPMSVTRGHFFDFVQFDGGIFPGKFCHVRENDNGRRGADQKPDHTRHRSEPAQAAGVRALCRKITSGDGEK